ERLQGYHVELAFPAKVVEEPMKHPGYVRDRSTRDMAFFRASGAMAPELFPGDSHGALTIRFRIDDDVFEELHRVASANVKASLYMPGQAPVVVEQPFRALHNY